MHFSRTQTSALAALVFVNAVMASKHHPPQRFMLAKRQNGVVPPVAGGASTTTTPAAVPTTTAAVDPNSDTVPVDETSTTTPVAVTTTPVDQNTIASTTTTLAAVTTTTPATTTPASRITTTTSARSSVASSVSEDITVLTSTSVSTISAASSSASSSASAAPTAAASSGSSSSGKTWAIVGGSVGGAILLAAIAYFVWRCTQRRFGELDHSHEDIKWPELQPDGQEVSTGLSVLNPQGTRRTGRAGVGDDEDDDEDWDDEKPSFGSEATSGLAGRGMAGPGYEQQQAHYGEIPYHGGGGAQGQYYDPYMAGAPPAHAVYPPPASMSPSGIPYASNANVSSQGAYYESSPYHDTPSTTSLVHSNSLNGGLYKSGSPSSDHLSRMASPGPRMPSPGAQSSYGANYGGGGMQVSQHGYIDRVGSPQQYR